MRVFTILLSLILFAAACETIPIKKKSCDASCDAGSSADVASSSDVAQAVEVSTPAPCVDEDKDNFCSTSPQPGDCNDKDPAINPGAAEKCGDGIDNNCNGKTDEGCTAPAVSNTLTVKYADSASRRLSLGVTSDKSSIPYVWNAQQWTTSDTFTADLGNIQSPTSKCLYVRFNVDEPGQHWLCEGNTTASAHLNSGAALSLSVLGKTYMTSQATTIVLGGGCSAIFIVSIDGANCAL